MVAKIQERRIRRQVVTDTENPSETSPLICPDQGLPLVIEFTAPREPLLEDD